MTERFRSKRGQGTLFQSTNGTWTIRRSQTVDGKRVRWTLGPYNTLAEAKAAQISDGGRTLAPNEAIQWDTYLQTWSEQKITDLLAVGSDAYAGYISRVVRLHLIPGIAHLRVANSTEEDFDQLWRQLLSRGLRRKYVVNIKGVAHLAGLRAMREGLLVRDVIGLSTIPLAVSKRTKHKTRKTKPPIQERILTPDEVFQLAAWCTEHPYEMGTPWGIATLIALETGARRGEVLGLRWVDIDWSDQTLIFRRQISQRMTPTGNVTSVKKPKGGKDPRLVSVGERLITALREHQRVSGGIGEGYVLVDPNGQHLIPDTFTKAVARTTTMAGVRRATPHDLRHTHVSLLLLAGTPDLKVSARVGHSTSVTTRNIYAHALPAVSDGLGGVWENTTGGES